MKAFPEPDWKHLCDVAPSGATSQSVSTPVELTPSLAELVGATTPDITAAATAATHRRPFARSNGPNPPVRSHWFIIHLRIEVHTDHMKRHTGPTTPAHRAGSFTGDRAMYCNVFISIASRSY